MYFRLGWTIGIAGRSGFIDVGAAVAHPLETTEATALGVNETDITGVVHIRDWNTAVAAAYRGIVRWHCVRNGVDICASAIPQCHQIRTKIKGMSNVAATAGAHPSNSTPIRFVSFQINLIWTCIIFHFAMVAAMFIVFYIFPTTLSSIGWWGTDSNSQYNGAIGGGYSVGGNIVACDNNKGKFGGWRPAKRQRECSHAIVSRFRDAVWRHQQQYTRWNCTKCD